jgi:putative transposase
VGLYFRFPLSLRMAEEMLAFRRIVVSHETLRQWGRKFGQACANGIRRRLAQRGDEWHLGEVVLKINGAEQPCGELASADTTTRTTDEAL